MKVGYPVSHDAVATLVQEHRALRDEVLLLAIYYAPERDVNDIFLFEIFDGFGANSVDADRNLFEVAYSARSTFPLEPNQQLRLVLTNPVEFERAASENWAHVQELRRAIEGGRYEVLYADAQHPELLRALGV